MENGLNMSFERIANNDSRIESLNICAGKAEIIIKTWDEKRIRIRCNGFYGIMNYSGLDEDIGDIRIGRDSDLFHKMAVSQFNCESKDVPQEINSLIICSAWDDHVIMEVIAKEFLEETV